MVGASGVGQEALRPSTWSLTCAPVAWESRGFMSELQDEALAIYLAGTPAADLRLTRSAVRGLSVWPAPAPIHGTDDALRARQDRDAARGLVALQESGGALPLALMFV